MSFAFVLALLGILGIGVWLELRRRGRKPTALSSVEVEFESPVLPNGETTLLLTSWAPGEQGSFRVHLEVYGKQPVTGAEVFAGKIRAGDLDLWMQPQVEIRGLGARSAGSGMPATCG